MKRSRQLFINLSIIAVILFGIYFFGGYYFSKEQCVLDALRSMYATERDMIVEYKVDGTIMTLLVDEDAGTYALVRTKKVGFLYQTGSVQSGFKMGEKDCVNVTWMSNDEKESMVLLYRNDKSVSKVEILLNNGEEYVVEAWDQDFGVVFIDTGDGRFVRGTYRGYDASGELVGEVQY